MAVTAPATVTTPRADVLALGEAQPPSRTSSIHSHLSDGSREALRETLEAINAKGFALTGGVMTRCESTKALVADTLDCGNFYVNRDVVGAVVESQPFGGHGLSGNGAKAGSEHYLEQFVARKVVCEDTTAAGGNLELMRTTG